MRTSEATELVFSALANAAKTLKNPKASETASVQSQRTGKTFTYKYPPFDQIATDVRDVLSTNGLSAIQEAITVGDRVGVTTRLAHESGQWIEMGPLLLPAGANAQEHGSALTYARRYALTAALLLAAEEDDDAASVKTSRRGSARSSSATTTPPSAAPTVPADSRPDSTAGVGDVGESAPPSESSSAGTNVAGGEPVLGKDGLALGPDPEQPHKFKGNDPNGPCEICHWLMESELHR